MSILNNRIVGSGQRHLLNHPGATSSSTELIDGGKLGRRPLQLGPPPRHPQRLQRLSIPTNCIVNGIKTARASSSAAESNHRDERHPQPAHQGNLLTPLDGANLAARASSTQPSQQTVQKQRRRAARRARYGHHRKRLPQPRRAGVRDTGPHPTRPGRQGNTITEQFTKTATRLTSRGRPAGHRLKRHQEREPLLESREQQHHLGQIRRRRYTGTEHRRGEQLVGRSRGRPSTESGAGRPHRRPNGVVTTAPLLAGTA